MTERFCYTHGPDDVSCVCQFDATAEATPAATILQALLGCAWGRTVRTEDDPDECPDQAVQIVVVHDGPRSIDLKLCGRHRDRVLAETTPRGGT